MYLQIEDFKLNIEHFGWTSTHGIESDKILINTVDIVSYEDIDLEELSQTINQKFKGNLSIHLPYKDSNFSGYKFQSMEGIIMPTHYEIRIRFIKEVKIDG